ncbi:MAG TPA: VOC family protein [Bryobacteraceae bacterium]|nr:VOC family protein [Bryobacteraceae bacterium]
MSSIAFDAATFGLSQIGQIALTANDLNRSIAFYRDSLGMNLLFEAPNLAFFDCGGIRLMLSTAEPAEQTDAFAVYFKVLDIQGAHRELARRGVVFEREPHLVARMPDHDLWMAFFRDPDRNLLAMMGEEARG